VEDSHVCTLKQRSRSSQRPLSTVYGVGVKKGEFTRSSDLSIGGGDILGAIMGRGGVAHKNLGQPARRSGHDSFENIMNTNIEEKKRKFLEPMDLGQTSRVGLALLANGISP